MGEDTPFNQKKTAKEWRKRLTLSDFFDPTQPWDLRDRVGDEKFRNLFNFLPEHFREGPWKPVATYTLVLVVCLVFYATIDANMKYDNDIIKDFVGDQSYPAFTITWFYNVGLFSWMAFVSWGVYSYYKSFGPWVSFTMCGWTIMWIRHGLCALAPFLPAVRLWIGILRFPVLLSSTTIFAVWNFVLMPVIALGILKGEKRKNFFRFANSWRMWQIHVLNILYAYLNCVWAEPNPSPLHMGDVDAAVFYIMTYMLFYYLIMDRLGMQFYPIFSPRTNMCIFSWMMTAGLCFGNYSFWNKVLSAKK